MYGRREGTYEKKAKTTSCCCGGLGSAILLGTKVSTKQASENTIGGQGMTKWLHRKMW